MGRNPGWGVAIPDQPIVNKYLVGQRVICTPCVCVFNCLHEHRRPPGASEKIKRMQSSVGVRLTKAPWPGDKIVKSVKYVHMEN